MSLARCHFDRGALCVRSGRVRMQLTMEQEAHQASGDDRVANPDVPVHPRLLEHVERGHICAGVEVSTPNGCGWSGSSGETIPGALCCVPAQLGGEDVHCFLLADARWTGVLAGKGGVGGVGC